MRGGNRKKIGWTEKELAWIKAHATEPRRDSHAAFCKKFSRQGAVSLDAYCNLCKRMGWLTGRDGRLQPGGVSWNKGKKMPFNANSARTQFKKGQRPHNTKQLGHEWMHPDGYVYIIVDERNPHTGFKHRSVMKHKHLWELKHGKVPKGHVLKCLDGDKKNTDPSNWQAVPLGVNALLNSKWSKMRYSQAPEELKQTVMAVAQLKYAKKVKTRKGKKQ